MIVCDKTFKTAHTELYINKTWGKQIRQRGRGDQVVLRVVKK